MGAGKIKFEHLRKTKDLPRHLEGNQGDKANLPSSRNKSSRDKELTKRRHGYQNYRPGQGPKTVLLWNQEPTSAPSYHDGPAWPCTGSLHPCIRRSPRETSALC